MSDYFYEQAQRQYDNQLPDRYNSDPLFECECCGDEIFLGEDYYLVGIACVCENCVSRRVAEREE